MANKRRHQMTENKKSVIFVISVPPMPNCTGSQKLFLHSVAVNLEIGEADIGSLTVEKERTGLHTVKA